MAEYELRINLESDALIGSGEGFGAIIDSDIIFDDLGLPYLPSRRIKGCLRESANEICFMLDKSGINLLGSLKIDTIINEYDQVLEIFGKPGTDFSHSLIFSNLVLNKCEDNRQALKYFVSQFPEIISSDKVLRYFTRIRQQTAIDEISGIAKQHSLRTIRVLNKGFEFSGKINLDKEEALVEDLLALACLNLRRIGGKRNRGFGEVSCKLMKNKEEIQVLAKLEKACNN
jgi:CRISPR/Cas system CSM-associated protein Csm3 (group 7 of RAMP superfamily)